MWPIVVGGLLVAAALAGCAAGSASAPGRSGADLGPADPLYRRTFTTPAGREWDFQIGGHVSER